MINKVILMGRLTKNPELRHTDSGKAVCNFSIAVSEGYGENQRTEFINCVAWNKTAEFVEKYFTKGRMIIVDGRISTRTWEGQDGKKNYATEVVANQVSFGESKKDSETSEDEDELDPSQSTKSTALPEGEPDDDEFVPLEDVDADDLPF